jgi:hypothetical protein
MMRWGWRLKAPLQGNARDSGVGDFSSGVVTSLLTVVYALKAFY